MSSYGYRKNVLGSFPEIVTRTTEALANEGFGVLSTIDLKSKLKEKLNVDVDEYVILGACSPVHAYDALRAEQEIGLLLPCNLIVYRAGNDIVVSAQLPTVAMQLIENKKLNAVAEEVELKLKKVIDSL